ncbi:MAG: hypothetical protein DWQ18_07870 [Crenarchaeota archaeon]|nr:MAG: hypothetical protein DWQ17_01915 [Thermoproteota archaeon]RDJ33079.1 MAG: hypothetical protein DWQ18_07870 [Thermoproteota archaeon]RDJ36417.1 MAG: hypothetical protein DWQ19_07450 [Thermoproteota archaeon]RDJ39046.1 MAG: hypothetical protein DWQ13_01915 [Thermoproteota archaeon]
MKPYRTRKVGKGVKRPNSKNMVGMKTPSKTNSIKHSISKIHSYQKSSIRELKLDIKKIENTIVSPVGLDKISAIEIEKIQDKRKHISLHMINVISNIVASARKLSYLEDKYQAK